MEILVRQNPNILRESILLFLLTSKKNFEEIKPSLRTSVYFIEKPFTNEQLTQTFFNINLQCNSLK